MYYTRFALLLQCTKHREILQQVLKQRVCSQVFHPLFLQQFLVHRLAYVALLPEI